MTKRVSKIVTNTQINRIVQIESAGKTTAKAGTSSAFGLGQFIKGTWLEELKEHRPDLFNGPPYDDEMALGRDPALQLEMLVYFTEDNARALGKGFTDGDLYLAHFSGIGTAKKLFRADPSTLITKIYKADAVKANRSILLNKDGTSKTVGEVRDWAQRSMINRWNKAGKPDWIAKYWKGRKDNAATQEEDDTDIDFVPAPRLDGETDEPQDIDTVKPKTQDTAKDIPGEVRGDPNLWQVQRRLKAMNYNPGGLDGKWGGMTSGALAAFINDRKLDMSVPTSSKAFAEDAEEINQALSEAESVKWTRPVSRERAEADQKKVEQTAPEVVPVRQNWLIALWGSIVTFFTGIYNSISGYLSGVWDFFMDHKDDVPDEAKSGLFDLVKEVPTPVWFALVASVLGWIAWNSYNGMKRITESVQTGERQ